MDSLNTGEKIGFGIALIPIAALIGLFAMVVISTPVYSGGTRHKKHKSNMSRKSFRQSR